VVKRITDTIGTEISNTTNRLLQLINQHWRQPFGDRYHTVQLAGAAMCDQRRHMLTRGKRADDSICQMHFAGGIGASEQRFSNFNSPVARHDF